MGGEGDTDTRSLLKEVSVCGVRSEASLEVTVDAELVCVRTRRRSLAICGATPEKESSEHAAQALQGASQGWYHLEGCSTASKPHSQHPDALCAVGEAWV